MLVNSPAEPAVTPVHAIRGRVRLRVGALEDRPDVKRALEEQLRRQPGIRAASASTVTGKLLVYYEPDRGLPEIIGAVEITVRLVAAQPKPQPKWVTPHPARLAKAQSPADRAGNRAAGFLRNLLHSLAELRKAPPRTMTARDLVRMAAPERPPRPWHTLTGQAALDFWKTSRTGLDSDTARMRLAKYGPNVLPHPKPRSAAQILLGQFASLPVLLLTGSAALSLAMGSFADTVAICVVLLLNGAIGAATELEAEKTLSALMTISEPIVEVLRDGEIIRIGGEDVVPGDILPLAPGAQVAADARLLEAENLALDESALTGESMPVEKRADDVMPPDTPLAERINLVHRGTVVSGGSGLAVVFATGRHTEIGRTQTLISESAQPETPLQRQMRGLGNQLLWFTGAVSAALFTAGILRGLHPLAMLRAATSLAVAAIPEGLPTIATVSLASGVRSLARHGALVRRLEAVEALGSVQVVCFDKTGTLTLNRMAVVAAFAGMRHYEVSGGSFLADHRPVQASSYPELARLMEISALCSEAEFDPASGAVTGSPTEAALLQMALKGGLDVARLRRKRPIVRVQHRATGQNYMATTHLTGHGTRITAVKGSPTEVLQLCGSQLVNGAERPLTPSDRRLIRAENERMAGAALRVLGTAFAETPVNGSADPGSTGMEAVPPLIWAGLVGIADPPRQGLRELIADFRRAGVRPVMLTGDQTATAHAIGRAMDLNGGENLQTIDSRTLDGIASSELAVQLERVQIFSRVDAAQKLQIVHGFQQGGAVVAMTGDGINDGPALKAADIGIALGQSGTRVARQVADIVLADDNLQSLLPALAEGRRVRENIRKAIHYISATNLSEIILMFGAVASGLGQPLNPRQLLWINLLSDVFPELALAVGPADPDLMNHPPAGANRPALARADYVPLGTQAAVMAAAALGTYAWGGSRGSPAAGTMAFLTLTSAQLLHGISARGPSGAVLTRGRPPANPYMTMSVLGGFGALALSQFGLTRLLGTVRLGPLEALVCAGASLASFLVNEALRRPRAEESALADEETLANNVAAGLRRPEPGRVRNGTDG
ncbi:MAG: HAD-IC family P-type ATPase [bacterium]|jgi:Ca2+-transporting ATPase